MRSGVPLASSHVPILTGLRWLRSRISYLLYKFLPANFELDVINSSARLNAAQHAIHPAVFRFSRACCALVSTAHSQDSIAQTPALAERRIWVKYLLPMGIASARRISLSV